MKLLPQTVVLAALLLPLTVAAQSTYRVTGTVMLRDKESQKPLKKSSQVAAWLVPLDGSGRLEPSTYNVPQYRMVQHKKRFTPHLLVVPTGSLVALPNLDPWFHNVFSLYRSKRFDLGLYQAGSSRSVLFDRPGPSYIFCNIHPEMSAVILAVDSHFIGISSTSGNIVIDGVPPGRYRLHFWYEFAADASNLPVRDIDVDGDTSFGKLTVTAKSDRDEKHSNKYGQPYDPQSLNPQY